MRFIKIAALIGVSLLILSACGQRGPLYSPEPETPEQASSTKASFNACVALSNGFLLSAVERV